MKNYFMQFFPVAPCWIVFLISSGAFGQVGNWPPSSSYLYFGANELNQSNSGNYAVLQSKTSGVTYVNSPSTLYFRIGNADRMRLTSSGNFGVGTTTPNAKLQVSGSGGANVDFIVNGRMISGDATQAGGMWVNGSQTMFMGQINATSLGLYNNGSWGLIADNAGNVGIGTTTPDSKLTVKGTIHTQEVKVDLNGAVAPDYVFEKDYPLTSLEELKSFIDQNKHLPEVPSAKDMEEKGINLKEMNLLLLKKVEELTLHLIEQQREINELKLK